VRNGKTIRANMELAVLSLMSGRLITKPMPTLPTPAPFLGLIDAQGRNAETVLTGRTEFVTKMDVI